MKRNLTVLFCVVAVYCVIALCGCGNKNMGISHYSYYFVTCDGPVKLQNEAITSWKDYEGEQMEITISNGDSLLISTNYCTLSQNKLPDEYLDKK